MYCRLRDLREDHDMKQKDLAAYLNCSRYTATMSSASVTYRRISSSACHSSIMCPWIISSV